MSIRRTGVWLDGAERAGLGEIFERRDPATGVVIGRFALGSASDLDAAASSARRAFDVGVWRRAPGSARGAVLLRFASLISDDLDAIAHVEAEEAGKTIAAAREELSWSLELIRYAATLAWSAPGRLVDGEGPGKLGLVSYAPLPVIGMILPWNFPSVTLFQKLPYALAAGCSVVVKPSEYTPTTAVRYAELLKKAGAPDGVMNVVPGEGGVVGEAMCRHPLIDMVSFTGSTAVGERIAATAGGALKKVALELGGKGANIVFADADFDAAVDGAVAAFTINQGEECCAGGRLLVEAPIAERFVAAVVDKARRLRLGGAGDPDAEIGPLIHEAHRERVVAMIAKARAEGAVLATGGGPPSDPALAAGCFVEPTVFTGVTPEMALFREEVFGPVLAVTPFRDADEAVALANDTVYGLANGVWTRDLDVALSVSAALESGFVYVNTYLETVPQLPFGGVKASGLGRENGPEGLLEFMRVKSTFIKSVG